METVTQKETKPEQKIKQKTLASLFVEACVVPIERALMHQAFQIQGAGTESTLSAHRTRGLKLVYHPGYGLIGLHNGKYFLSPAPNVIVAHE